MLNSTFNNVLNHQAISQDRWLKYLYEPTSPKDNYRTLHPATTEYTFFPDTHGAFTSVDHILECETNLNKLKSYKMC